MNAAVHKPCNGDSSSDATNATTVQHVAQEPCAGDDARSSLFLHSGSLEIDAEAMATAWTYVSLTQEIVQVALDAVRYRQNYARGVTSRLCLHYINSIRRRLGTDSITSYLFSVDGCEGSEIVPSGRCDIYYCQPYTYELQIAQKAVGSDVFTVQSIYKTLTQKSLTELREDSNLDFTTASEGSGVTEPAGFIQETDPAKIVQSVLNEAGVPRSTATEEKPGEKPIALESEVKYAGTWESDGVQGVVTKPLPLHIQRMSMAESSPEQSSGAAGPRYIAIIGIVTVAIAVIAFAVAVAVGRWRARVKARERALSQQYPPLRVTLMTSENTISMTSRDSIAVDTTPTCDKIDLAGHH